MARVFSGIQPSGEIHIGNYIGALRHFVADQEVDDCIFCIVDLHAITVSQDPATLRAKTLDLAAIYLAVGLDPTGVTLFVQSHVHEHAELAWTLGCFTSIGELRRMTQFKDKSARQGEGFVSAGLFTYPALMAADILLYDTDRVPVGDDQRQHLELARDVAGRVNQRFPGTFVVPDAAVPKLGARIMDLADPTSKMSKSADSPMGTVLVTDPPEILAKKVRAAVTDSGREVRRGEDKPAITNLLAIFSVAAGRPVEELEREYGDEGYARFKADLADALIAYLGPFRERYARVSADLGEVARILDLGADKAQAMAAVTLARVYERVGFLPRGR